MYETKTGGLPEAVRGKLQALTQREWQVLISLTKGVSTKQLADQLEVRPRTVQKHLQRIYAKLGVTGRTAAVLMVVRSGISQD